VSEKITNIFASIRHTIQVDHLSFKKVKDNFENYPFNDEFLCNAFHEIHTILDALTFIPKMGIKQYLHRKLIEIFRDENESINLHLVFERRQPIFIPHNGHKFMRNRKMNLRSIYEYAVLSYIAAHYFSETSIQNGIQCGGLPITGIQHTLNIVSTTTDSVMVFDIFSCFENISCGDIKRFLESDINLVNYGVKYALTLLDNDLPMYMDNEFDKFFVKKYIDILTDKFILEQSEDTLNSATKILGTDEIVFYFHDKAFTGNELHKIEKSLDKFISDNTAGKLKLNKSKSKLLNKENINDFVKDVVQDYTEYKQFGKFLSSFCYDYPTLSSEEILLRIKANPSLFKHLIREFTNTNPDKIVYNAFRQSYETVFKGILYNDLQLFFERKILGIEKTY